jgi:hypothetical protein
MARTDSAGSRLRCDSRAGPTSCSPSSRILPSPASMRCPAKTITGWTATGDIPKDATADSATLVTARSLAACSPRDSPPARSFPSKISGAERQFLTSRTNTPPGPTSSMSTLAALVPGHLRSTNNRHPRAVRTNNWAATLRSPSPAASQRTACRRALCHCSLSNRSCRRASCARLDADPPAAMPRSPRTESSDRMTISYGLGRAHD